ncbi:MAG: capsular biosynthesis protein, partial [Cyclobacteriaceae bacterium]
MQRNFPLKHQFENSAGTETGFNIDYKRVLYHLYKYWYFVLLFLLLCIALAFVKNRYSTRIYPIKASIIIKETEESSEGKFILNNPLVNFYKNYLNELYIVKSYPLIKKTIEVLNFQSSFYQECSVVTSENYKSLPVSVKVIDEKSSLRGFSLHFKAISDVEFTVEPINKEDQF